MTRGGHGYRVEDCGERVEAVLRADAHGDPLMRVERSASEQRPRRSRAPAPRARVGTSQRGGGGGNQGGGGDAYGGGEPSRDSFDEGRSRRKRGGGSGGGAPSEDWGDYGGAEG